ncbi:bifunctional 4-hydroxy-2-oxoglutarate aldolase/2-dehydro-3-deoxy-phosphogluconate aldolase [Clostridium bowmanii]|uniref:bifunctional 4-hydroxy-2-oxoglutarate aldolase/2-dehydro-3-deoxy-phosphogluconate aldolase n=1 Tax=Clostridium bowmanii TaxID=132925 RepID=UPI001C0B3A7D|nr:bifunctional 4-hydroxy-2-oxoglutarate aldolase/2-dehydro-3-deoxy-phosphogluconate aldolase [Clostridium bowmanii]MBU3191937.1 bifunctional 4-hydroxy-2-oxoglutarate aldolase/2-dehydro-3-deoxy-phosphogluconate aldolase [Clostridium bowmanii]MCA1074506.1 bifunctional 4-hydroxy-2-oxoglutarate aldolase/2-dehydro-3-deoxy-phosphogluconate aldolase [Clostridium bowmanii]
MNKIEIKEALRGKLIAVVRQENAEIAKILCRTLIESGIDVLEITFSVDNAEKLIKELREEFPNAIIGAGTVLSEEQSKLAIENGAQFIVSPCIVEEVAEYCKKNDVCCSLGAATPTEVFKAYQLGCDIVKLFPGDCISPKMIKGIKAPMPFVEMMPTGGVNDKNIKEWFEAGAYAAGFGGYLFNGVNENNLDVLRERCRNLIEAYNA